MNDLLPKNDPYLSPREQNLIRIIDDFKRERYPGETGEIWLSAERIFEKVKEDGREPIGTIKTLDHELKKMSEKGVIRERKALRAKHYEYLVDTTKPFLVPIVLPDPHLVKDGNFDQSPIKILNPITGRVDEI